MTNSPARPQRRRLIAALLCTAVLCGILLAGLLPFRGPRNGVTWLPNQNGLELSGRATLWSLGSFAVLDGGNGRSCSLELWLQPGRPHDSNVILAFSDPQTPLRLTLRQYRSVLELRTGTMDYTRSASMIGTEGVFLQGAPSFVTITSGPEQTTAYVNGQPRRTFPHFHIASQCAGQLVLGTSPTSDAAWHGQLRGVALYGRELTLDQVRRHFETWTAQGRPELSDGDRVVALYLFNEHAGNVAHSAVEGGLDLRIPARYALVHQTLLRPFWKEYKLNGEYLQDVLTNIIGFMPLGFFFYAYWSSVCPIRRAALITVVLGFGVSLTIEVLQAHIPTRDSGTTDLMTNTLGTFLGVRVFGWSVVRALLARIYPPAAP